MDKRGSSGEHDSSAGPSQSPSPVQALFQEADEDENDLASVWSLLKLEATDREEDFDASRVWGGLQRQIDSERRESNREPSGEREQPFFTEMNFGSSTSEKRDEREPNAPEERASGAAGQGHLRKMLRTWGPVLLLVLTVAAAGLWFQPVTKTAPTGERISVELPDGSFVELNGGSKIAYQRRSFSNLPFFRTDVRRIRLEGEAFFSVRRGERKFVVKTRSAQVEALGTKFTVETWSVNRDPTTAVTLRSGRVRLKARNRPEEQVVLSERGSRSLLASPSGRPTDPSMTDLSYAEAWRDGGFAVRQAPLTYALSKLERQFGVTVDLEADTLKTSRMTLLYAEGASADEVLSDICIAQGLSCQKSGGRYVLSEVEH